MSTATSRIFPLTTVTNLACAFGGFWKCKPRITDFAEWEKLSWINVVSIPFDANSDYLKLSKKKPLSSENDCGSISMISGIFNFLNVNGMSYFN